MIHISGLAMRRHIIEIKSTTKIKKCFYVSASSHTHLCILLQSIGINVFRYILHSSFDFVAIYQGINLIICIQWFFTVSNQSHCQQSNFNIREKCYHHVSVLLRESILGQVKCQLIITIVFPPAQWYDKNATNYHLVDTLHNKNLLS